jgi:predicted pyridoxine 5'-phosphate oxidase superfamily flavin-nucleotide-binding protein
MSEAKSPFHRGEKELQSRLGIEDKMEQLGPRMVRDYMPEEHQEFFSRLPLLIGSWPVSPGSSGRQARAHST